MATDTALKEELTRLRRENRVLRMERDLPSSPRRMPSRSDLSVRGRREGPVSDQVHGVTSRGVGQRLLRVAASPNSSVGPRHGKWAVSPASGMGPPWCGFRQWDGTVWSPVMGPPVRR